MKVSDAQAEIAKILAAVETEQDCIVDGVEIHNIDVTGIEHDRQQLQRVVEIRLHRIPGNNWGQAGTSR